MQLWHKVTLGLILGVFGGIFFPEYVSRFRFIGDIFLRMIKMIIPLVIFFSLVSGITSMNDPHALGRVGTKAAIAFLVTTCFAVLFGLTVGLIAKPGLGVNIDFERGINSAHRFNITEFIINIIPSNPINALAEGNVLQIVFMALFTSIAINKMNSSAGSIKSAFHNISKVVIRMILMIIQLSPYAAFALISWVISTQGVGIIVALSKLFLAIIFAMVLQYVIFGILIIIFCRISPIPFYKKSLEYQLLAFSTSSSKATLATTMNVCKEKLGISESSTSFILPLGAAINMDGLAISLGLIAIFFAQLMGVTLYLYDYFVIVVTATIGSIGGAGIPGALLIMLPMVLSSINLPIEGVAILAGIDRILDMLRTTINITGDATITLIIDHSEGTLDQKKYYS